LLLQHVSIFVGETCLLCLMESKIYFYLYTISTGWTVISRE
jgi:hypothetical protein